MTPSDEFWTGRVLGIVFALKSVEPVVHTITHFHPVTRSLGFTCRVETGPAQVLKMTYTTGFDDVGFIIGPETLELPAVSGVRCCESGPGSV